METEGEKIVETDCLAAAPTDADEVKMYAQKDSGAKDNSGPLYSVNSLISVASQKTTLIQHGIKIYSSNQNTLLCIIKCLPTNVIKGPITIWRWDQVQGCNFIIIRWGLIVEGRIFIIWFTNDCLCYY